MLQNLTIEEQLGVITFLTAEGVILSAIYRQMVNVNYGTVKSVKKWSARFRAGHECLVDVLSPGLIKIVIMDDSIHKVDNLVKSDCHVTLRMLKEKMNISIGIVRIIVHERLRYRKMCTGAEATH